MTRDSRIQVMILPVRSQSDHKCTGNSLNGVALVTGFIWGGVLVLPKGTT